MTLRASLPVFRILGMLLVVLGVAMLPPLGVDLASGARDLPAIEAACLATLFVGTMLFFAGSVGGDGTLDRRQAFAVTAAAWLVVPVFAALPFAGVGLSPVDAWFEAVSALTTTGATVITGLDSAPRGILLWRSFLQWLGGIGIVVMALSLLPFMRVGGMQLFHTESSDTAEKTLGDPIDYVRWIFGIYGAMTLGCATFYYAFGMTGFDALNHAMTTVSTGGFSTHDASFGAFSNPALLWTATVFMIAGALPFVFYIRWLMASRDAHPDKQANALIGFLAVVSLLLALHLVSTGQARVGEAVTLAAFHVTSIVTTTGFASTDYTSWGAPAVGAFFLLTFVGGCSGSTAGGFKMYRIQVVIALVAAHLKRLLSPSRIVPVRYGKHDVTHDVTVSILVFAVLFVATVFFGGILLAATGLDLVTALSASATSVANVGPGLGPIVGPSGNFSSLSAFAKGVLGVEMLAGRLEFFALLVVLTPAFWRV